MSGPRLSSVYDFSSLRLHPDGSRVQQNTSKNLRPRYAASAVQDPRGNWFARDAAGFGTVGRYRKVREEADGEEIDVGEDGQELSRRKGKGKAKERIPGRRPNPRPAKRRKFLHDFDFLAPSTSSSSSSEYPLPSSDLLKSIHYFASTYYHERGQLINLTKEYRKMRKQRRLLRLEQEKKVETARETSEGYEEEEDSVKPVRRGGRVKGAGKRTHPKDMYKVLDGSALVAIGMLMQEYVSRMLEVRIPDGWEDMIRQAYANAKEDTPEAEDEQDFGNTEAHDAEEVEADVDGQIETSPTGETEVVDNEESDEEEHVAEGEDEGDDEWEDKAEEDKAEEVEAEEVEAEEVEVEGNEEEHDEGEESPTEL